MLRAVTQRIQNAEKLSKNIEGCVKRRADLDETISSTQPKLKAVIQVCIRAAEAEFGFLSRFCAYDQDETISFTQPKLVAVLQGSMRAADVAC